MGLVADVLWYLCPLSVRLDFGYNHHILGRSCDGELPLVVSRSFYHSASLRYQRGVGYVTSGPRSGRAVPYMSISAERRVYFCQLVEALIEEHDDDTSERTIRMRSHGATTTGCAWMTG